MIGSSKISILESKIKLRAKKNRTLHRLSSTKGKASAQTATPYTTLSSLRNYFAYTQEHYPNVEEIVFSLVGLIVWKASNHINVRVAGKIETETVFMFQIKRVPKNSHVYFHLIYNSRAKCFEIRKKSPDGELLAKYNNHSSVNKMIKEVGRLGE